MKAKPRKTAMESMESRESPNLELLLKEGEKWLEKLEGDEKKYQRVLEVVDFVDYVDKETAEVLIKETGKLLEHYKDKIEEFDSVVCDIGCTASRDSSQAKREIEELAKKPVYEKPDRSLYEGNHKQLIF